MNIRFDSFMTELIILGFPFPELYLKYGDQIKSYFSGREISI